MDDVMRTNAMTVASTPTVTDGALSTERTGENSALLFDGSTDSFSVADSTSMSITGSLSISCFVKLTSTPGSTKTIFDKASSYRLQVDTNRKLLWRLDNGGSNVTVTSNEALTVGQWYHVVCVYNDNYAGDTTFGQTSFGASVQQLFGDYSWNSSSLQWVATNFTNLRVSKFTLEEQALVTDLQLHVKIFPSSQWMQYVMGVIYSDSAGAPDQLLAQGLASANSPMGSPVGGKNVDGWLTLPVAAHLNAGDYWLGFEGGYADSMLRYGYNVVGNALKIKIATLGVPQSGIPPALPPTGSAPDPFGSPSTESKELAIFANYTPLARTGFEGKAYIYIDGTVDNSASYTSGIADTANAFTHATTDAAVAIDELAIWDRVLSNVEVGTLYRMR